MHTNLTPKAIGTKSWRTSIMPIRDKKRFLDVTSLFVIFSACGVKEDGTRVDFPPKWAKSEESPNNGGATLSPPSLPNPSLRSEEKTRIDVVISSVEGNERNAVHEIMS